MNTNMLTCFPHTCRRGTPQVSRYSVRYLPPRWFQHWLVLDLQQTGPTYNPAFVHLPVEYGLGSGDRGRQASRPASGGSSSQG